MRKLVALEPQVYEKLKEGVGRVETPILNNLDQEMQVILNSQRPAHEKLRLYDAALRKSEQFEKKTVDVTSQAVEDRILSDFDRQMQDVLNSQKLPHEKIMLYNDILRKSGVYEKKRRARRVQKKDKLAKKEILKHFKKSKSKKVKQILSGIENQKNITWNDAGNLVLDDRAIPSSDITELLRSAVVKKEPTIPGWSTFDKTLPWTSF